MKTGFIQNALTATQAPRRRPLKKEMEARRQSQLQDIERRKRSIEECDRRIIEAFDLEKNGENLAEWKEVLLKYRATDMDFLFSAMSRAAALDFVIKILPR